MLLPVHRIRTYMIITLKMLTDKLQGSCLFCEYDYSFDFNVTIR